MSESKTEWGQDSWITPEGAQDLLAREGVDIDDPRAGVARLVAEYIDRGGDIRDLFEAHQEPGPLRPGLK